MLSFLEELGGWRALLMLAGFFNVASLSPILDWILRFARRKTLCMELTASIDVLDHNVPDTFAAVASEISRTLEQDPEASKGPLVIKEIQLRRYGQAVRVFNGGVLRIGRVAIRMATTESTQSLGKNMTTYITYKWTMLVSAPEYSTIDAFTKACVEKYELARTAELAALPQSLYTVAQFEKDEAVFKSTPFKTTKTFDNLFFPLRDSLMKELDRFENNEDWYRKVGKPYRMNLMLSGPPGTAKSSSCKAIANKTGRHVVLLDTSKFSCASQLCNSILNFPGKHGLKYKDCMFVIEELDCWASATAVRESEADTDSESVCSDSPSSKGSRSVQSAEAIMAAEMVAEAKQKSASQLGVLLNFLDGVQEMHGSMILVTTNHPEKFDPALTRPGRLDTFHFEKLGPPEIAQFWRLYFDEDPPADAPTSATVAELTTLMSRRTRKIP
jgi:ATPase family associated with various cellular activities (AAA)